MSRVRARVIDTSVDLGTRQMTDIQSFMSEYGPRLLDGGFRIVPIPPRKKRPGYVDGRGDWKTLAWDRFKANAPQPVLVQRWGAWPDCGIGIICGEVVAVDIDLDDEALCDTAYGIFNQKLGATPAVRIGSAPRRLLVYRTETPFKKISTGPIEVLADGQQFVAYGIHPLGHEYRWVDERLHDLTMADLPVVTEAQVREAVDAVLAALPESVTKGARVAVEPRELPPGAAGASTSVHGQEGTPEAVAEALQFIPNDDVSWDDWNRIGMAIYGALGPAGYNHFETWSLKSAKCGLTKSETPAARWAAYMKSPPTQLGAGTIYFKAMQHGWVCPPELSMKPLSDGPKPDFSALLANGGAASVPSSDTSLTEVYSSVREEVTRAMIDDGARWVEHVCLWNRPMPNIPSPIDGKADLTGFDTRQYLPIARGWRVPAGAGKTEIAIQSALKCIDALRASGSEKAVVIATPTHALAEQLKERVERIAGETYPSVTVRIYRGRRAQVPGALDGRTMCQNLKDARNASEHELNVRNSVCESCSYRESCALTGYLSQDDLDADIWIITHQYLFLSAPPPIARRGVGGVIVDENYTLTAGLLWVDQPRVIPLKAMAPGGMRSLQTERGEFLDTARKKLAAACQNTGGGPLTIEAVQDAGFTYGEASDAANLEWKRIVGEGPELAQNKTIRPMEFAFHAIEELMQTNGQIGGGWLLYDEFHEKEPSLVLKGRQRVGAHWRLPTIILDANLNSYHHALY